MNSRVLFCLLYWGATVVVMAADVPAESVKSSKTLLDQLIHGGPVMIPIGFCLLAMLYLSLEGFLLTTRQRLVPPDHVTALQEMFRRGDYRQAYQYCKETVSPYTNLVREAISFLSDGKALMEEAVLSALAKENARLQTRISYLSVIGVCTPMIGLTGTCVGMIKAFDTMGSSGISDPTGLAAAIGEVLVATASGLFIAIPAFIAYYVLRNRTQGAMTYLESQVMKLFRKVPFECFEGVHIGDEEIYAAKPNWVGGATPVATQGVNL